MYKARALHAFPVAERDDLGITSAGQYQSL